MDVEQAPLEPLHELRRQDAHETGQRHELGAARVEFGAQRRFEVGAVGKGFDRDHRGRYAERGGARQAAGARRDRRSL